MPNTNCLEGMKCPECESEGPFMIFIFCTAEVWDSGIEEYGDTEWDKDSSCGCNKCGFDGKVAEFYGN